MPHVEDNLRGLVFYAHYVGPRDQNQVIRLGSHLSAPKGTFKPSMMTHIYEPSTVR